MQTIAAPTGTDRPRAGAPLIVAGLAAVSAGAIHAVAAGAHSEHPQAVVTFVALAVLQLGWGSSVLRSADRTLAGIGAVIAALALIGWAAVKTTGIGAIEGLGAAESVQAADAIAAGLALVTLAGCALRLVDRVVLPALGPVVAMAVVAVALPGMVTAGTHDHDHGDDQGHDDDLALIGDDHGHETDDGEAEVHEAAVVPPTPYDPDLPLNLSGVEGVTLEQQARAEQLIAVTLYRLPKYANPADAEADGFHSIGDGVTGYEHYVNRDYINDDKILDPDYPESLVYQVVDGEKTLVAAMYMLPDGETLDTVPDVGGPLTQWHIHNNLCYTPDPVAPTVAGLTDAEGNCREGLVKGNENPMIHVWIVPHECGPFAALEGVAGGQIPEGEERLCDHVHGSGG
jgi:hypothetical protein